tara:strand:+ start:5947 stop:7131 length:1185 start_codon:yes stop_codon:yes gene_type:complete
MKNLFLSFINSVSSLIKKNKKLIITCGINFNSFNENTRYLYLYLSKKKDFEIYWMTENEKIFNYLKKKKLKVIKRKSLKSFFLLMRAGIIISSGESYPNFLNLISKNTIKISLRHGAGPKFSAVSYEISNKNKIFKVNDKGKSFIKEINKSDYINFTSNKLANIFENNFFISRSKIKILGFPRCDHLFNKKLSRDLYNKKIISKKYFKINKRDKIILYAPTWRLNEKKFPIEFLSNFNWKKFNNFLFQNNLYFFINLHTYSNLKLKINLNRIKIIKKNELFDINQFLPEVDILITDYSAIATDYAILKRKIIYVIPDYDEFKKINGFFVDIKKFNAGLIAKDNESLLRIIKEKSKIDNVKIKRYLKFYYDTNITNSSEQVYEFLKNKVNNNLIS